jgi:CDP-diacylglycerol--serine O-phosphatidyltransferase
MERPVPRYKSFYILPNLFTTASLFSGFAGLLWASAGHYEECALAVLFSALMDGLDGRVARLTNTASEFGVQYDSLADMVAFGVTPAFLAFAYALHAYNRLGMAVSFLFAVCAALRLARFNVTTSTADKRFFTGLPAPAAGCSLACCVLVAPLLPQAVFALLPGALLFCTAGIAFLMVSHIRYAAFKELGVFKAHPFRTIVLVICLFVLIAANPKLFGSLALFVYILSGLAHTFLILPRMSRISQRAAPSAAEQPPAAPTAQASAEDEREKQ